MKKGLLGLLILVISISANAQTSFVTNFGNAIDTATFIGPYKVAIAGKQASLSGTGLVRMTGSTVSYDASVFLTANQSISVGVTGSDITGVATASSTSPSVALTLTTVNSNVGTFGTASSVSTNTVDAKGRTTAIVNTPIVIAESAVTSLTSDLAGKQGSIIFTTTGSGVATFSGNALNIPTPATAVNNKYSEEYTGATTSTITLSNTPISLSVRPFKNGVRLPGIKYSVAGAVVTLTDTRVSGDIFSFDYNY